MASRSTSFPNLDATLVSGGNARARERVTAFLEDHLRTSGMKVGDRLPTSRAIARHLDVSVTTVQNVFRQLAAEGFLRTEIGNGSFLAAALPATRKDKLRIGLSFGISSTGDHQGSWSSAISGAIVRAASLKSTPVSICPVTIQSQSNEEIFEALKEQDGHVDGMILHPVLEGMVLARQERKLSYPIVHLNPGFTTASSNFVSSDFYGISLRLGAAWAATGRQRVLFVHNSGEQMNASAALRCSGLVAGLGNHIGNGVSLRIISGDEATREAGYELAETVLGATGPLPDAIYIVGDDLALGFCHQLAERGLEIPRDVSVVGGSGAAQLAGPYRDLTRTQQPTEEIGTALFEMACQLATTPGLYEVPGKFVPCSFIGGTTTRKEENEILHFESDDFSLPRPLRRMARN